MNTQALLILCSILAIIAHTWQAHGEEGNRVAMIIGIDDYDDFPLENAVRDATAVRDMMQDQLGFDREDIVFEANPERLTFFDRFETFKKKTKTAEIVLLYFAGHGMESLDGKENFILPSDTDVAKVVQSEAALRAMGINLMLLSSDLASISEGAKIILLDCCRERPAGRGSARAGGGLVTYSDTRIPADTLMMLAAAPNRVASDGERHGPFTMALLEVLPESENNLMEAFFKVSDRVVEITRQTQTPWLKFDGAGKIFRDNYFSFAVPEGPPNQPPKGPGMQLPANAKKDHSTTPRPKNKGAMGDALILTAIPDENIENQMAKLDKLAEHLSLKLQVQTKFTFSSDYLDCLNRFKNGEVHLGWFGGLSGAQARMEVPGARAIAQGETDPQYKSCIIAHKDTGLRESASFPVAIKDMTFTFGSPGSTSGRLMPTYFILQNNGEIPLSDWFATEPGFQMSGGHVATAKAVASEVYQTGALATKTYDALIQMDPLIRENTVKVWTTPSFTNFNFTIHPVVEEMFGEGFIDRVQAALIEVPSESDAVKGINRESIITAENEDFDAIKKTALEVGLLAK